MPEASISLIHDVSAATATTSIADHDIQSMVLGRLNQDRAVMPADIGVLVLRGSVTLCGVVDTIAQVHAAVRATQGVPGVSAVVDELLVFLSSAVVRVDATMAVVAEALSRDPDVPTARIRISAKEDGTVVLTGSVPSSAERTAATRVVEHQRNVRIVENRLLLERPVATKVAMGRVRNGYPAAHQGSIRLPARQSL